jgi:hypothetical protein
VIPQFLALRGWRITAGVGTACYGAFGWLNGSYIPPVHRLGVLSLPLSVRRPFMRHLLNADKVPPCDLRWGDYLGATEDPSDASHVWLAGLYQIASLRWGWTIVIASVNSSMSCRSRQAVSFVPIFRSPHTADGQSPLGARSCFL